MQAATKESVSPLMYEPGQYALYLMELETRLKMIDGACREGHITQEDAERRTDAAISIYQDRVRELKSRQWRLNNG